MNSALDTSLLSAMMLLVAIIGGYFAKWVRIPRIVAYIVGGIILRSYLGHTYSPEHLGNLPQVDSFDLFPHHHLKLKRK